MPAHASRLLQRLPKLRDNWAFWALSGFLALTFLMGGASRGDVISLLILRPLAAIVCGLALLTLTRNHVRDHRFLFGMTGAVIVLILAHLIPLPPALWTALPGRAVVVAMEQAAGLPQAWRPLTFVPSGAWNALFACLVPLAVLLLGVQLTREQRYQLLSVILAMGAISAVLGLLQLLGGRDSPFYLYQITNPTDPVGLFANRNHQSVFLTTLFPLLAIFAVGDKRVGQFPRARLAAALGFAAFLVPLIIVVGSRAGLLTGLINIAVAIWIYRTGTTDHGRGAFKPAAPWWKTFLPIGVGALAVGLIVLTIIMSRGVAFTRLLDTGESEFDRQDFWPVVLDASATYFPFGSGAGSFAETFQVHEPDALLNPQYVNHAHNDWLEIYMTLGLPGVVLLISAVVAFVLAAKRVVLGKAERGRAPLFNRLGLTIILTFGIASIADYPLRVPSLVCLLVIAALWLHPSSQPKTPDPART